MNISFKNLKIVGLSALLCVFTISISGAQTVLFDFGQDTNTTAATGWNNYSDAALSSGTIWHLGNSDSYTPVDSLGNSLTGLTATLSVAAASGGSGNENNIAGSGANSANTNVTHPDSGTLYVDSASQDALNVQGTGSFEFTLTGLNVTDSLDLYFYGAASNFVSSRSQYTLNTGTASVTSVIGLTGGTAAQSSVSILNVTPDGTGTVSILFDDPDGITGSEGAGGTRARWNTLEIDITPVPEPSAVILLALGTVTLIGLRKRKATK